MSVTLRQPDTGEIKIMPEGWCWSCCLFCGVLGLPLYRRGLQVWGSAMVVFNIVLIIVSLIPTERADRLDLGLTIVGIGLCIFFGARANRMAIDRYLDLGWQYADPIRRRFS